MAAPPVSPLVAPTTVMPLLDWSFLRKSSKRLPRNCRATSLKAKVGPWKSSQTQRFFKSMLLALGWRVGNFLVGVTSSCEKEEKERMHKSFNSVSLTSETSINGRYSLNASWSKERVEKEVISWRENVGMLVGTYNPPSGASPWRTAWRKESRDGWPRVLLYCICLFLGKVAFGSQFETSRGNSNLSVTKDLYCVS